MKIKKHILLSKNPYICTILDLIDYARLCQGTYDNWRLHQPDGPDGSSYAVRSDDTDPDLIVYLHQHILGLDPTSPREVCHKNGDTLDNSQNNLILARDYDGETDVEIELQKLGRKGPKGYHWDSKRGKYFAVIYIEEVRLHLGTFNHPQDARATWQEARWKARQDRHALRSGKLLADDRAARKAKNDRMFEPVTPTPTPTPTPAANPFTGVSKAPAANPFPGVSKALAEPLTANPFAGISDAQENISE